MLITLKLNKNDVRLSILHDLRTQGYIADEPSLKFFDNDGKEVTSISLTVNVSIDKSKK